MYSTVLHLMDITNPVSQNINETFTIQKCCPKSFNQPVALLRCNGSPGCFDGGLQPVCIVGFGGSNFPQS